MPSVVVADFKYGLDHRRPRAAEAPGTLWTLTNALISRGGDIERSKKWVASYTLPAATYGLSNISGQLWVFGSTDLAASMPVGVQYQRLNPSTSATGTITFTTNPADTNTLTLNGTVVTFVASGATGNQVNIGATTAATLGALLSFLQNSTDTQISKFNYFVSGLVLNLSASVPGTGGNALTIATSVAGTTLSAGTLSGGLGPAAHMTDVKKVETFAGNFYVIAEYDDGNVYHWYNGVQMTEWDMLSDANSSVSTLATYLASKIDGDASVSATASGSTILITADTPGTAFSVAGNNPVPGTITVTTLQANVPAVAEVVAHGTITVASGAVGAAGVNRMTALAINGVSLIASPVDFITDINATANAISVAINNNATISGYLSSVVNNVVTVSAATGTGATPNGLPIAPSITGNFNVVATALAGGVTAVAAVAQVTKVALGGTYVSTGLYLINVTAAVATNYVGTGRASGYGTSAFTYKQRVYFPAGLLLRYCGLSDPTMMAGGLAASGPGFLSVANDSEGNDPMLCLSTYQTLVALFSRRSIRIYDLQSDATLNLFKNPLQNTGTFAPNSVVAYGNTDVFYLDDTGIRSVQARDVTNTPFVSDVGSPIDTIIQDWYRTVGEVVASNACSAIEPLDGRFMMAIGSNIFTLSYFPNAKITAWSVQQPGFTATDFTASKRRLYARSTIGGVATDTIYLYGGPFGTTYANDGELTTTFETSFVSAKTLDKIKEWQEFSMACQNVWDIYLLVDPDDDTKAIHVGKISKNSYDLTTIATIGEFPYVAVRGICTAAGAASVSNMSLKYGTNE